MMVSACVDQASAAYGVPVASIEQVIDSRPQGGFGIMGIPVEWLPILSKAGFDRTKVVEDKCTNVEAGTWVLAFLQLQSGHAGAMPSSRITATTPAGNPQIVDHGPVTDTCIERAASFYHLPVALFSAVLRTEAGEVGKTHVNSNGTYDMGPAQINSSWLPTLERNGITRSMVLNDGCLNISLGAWILAQSMEGADPSQPAQYWRHVGDYNSHTPAWNDRYARLVWNNVR